MKITYKNIIIKAYKSNNNKKHIEIDFFTIKTYKKISWSRLNISQIQIEQYLNLF